VTIGKADTMYYLLDVYRKKMEFPELKVFVQAHAAKWMPHTICVEDKASGQSLIQELQRETILTVYPIKCDTDKVVRAQAVTPIVEAGRVAHPVNAAWVVDFIDELATFPNAKNDDQVDAFDGALEYLARGGGNLGMLDWLREEILAAEKKKKERAGSYAA